MRVTDPRSREATEAPTARDEPELSREDLSKKLMWWQDKIDKILSGQDIRMDENVATLIGPHPEDQLGEVKEVLPWDAVMRRISRREALSRMNEEVERLWKLVYAEEWSQETPAPPAARGRTGQRPTPSGQ